MSPLVDTAQTTWELHQMVALVADLKPAAILEIGIWEGGTLLHWLRHAQTVTAVDDTMRDPGPSEWHRWAEDEDATLHLLHGDSRDPDIVESVRRRGPYDLVFIDGDHIYDSVKADWENYRGMVGPGGVVAFHDIVPRDGYGVSELWSEIKAEPGARTLEIIENSGRYNGIGVVTL